jgi:hypothetical protein
MLPAIRNLSFLLVPRRAVVTPAVFAFLRAASPREYNYFPNRAASGERGAAAPQKVLCA